MMLVTDEDTFEMFLRDLESQGNDMSLMREAREEIRAIPTGDHTPPPRSVQRAVVAPVVEPLVVPDPIIVFPPPMHEGWNMPPDGKFLLPYSPERATTRQVRRLSRRVNKLALWLTGLTMCFISAVTVIAWRW